MKIIHNWYNYTSPGGEVNNMPSATVPDMVMSLKEIEARFTRPGALDSVQQFTPSYLGESQENFPDNYERMTAQERIDLSRSIAKEVRRHQLGMKKPQPAPTPDIPQPMPTPAPVSIPAPVSPAS